VVLTCTADIAALKLQRSSKSKATSSQKKRPEPDQTDKLREIIEEGLSIEENQ
jgi:hypothetical protein